MVLRWAIFVSSVRFRPIADNRRLTQLVEAGFAAIAY